MLKSQIEKASTAWRRRWYLLLVLGFVISGLFGWYHVIKPLPEGLTVTGEAVPVNLSDLSWLADETFADASGPLTKQTIMNTIAAAIDGAQQYILLDMFLFNDHATQSVAERRRLAEELTIKLLAKKRALPDIRITVITDPINEVYGGATDRNLQLLREADIRVITTDLSKLRDSNPTYSGAWRWLFSWLGVSGPAWLPHPFAAEGSAVTLRAWLTIPNFKANHRKVFLADQNGRLLTIVGSANVHGPSSRHSNTAWLIKGEWGRQLYQAEAAVAALSGSSVLPIPDNLLRSSTVGDNAYALVTLLTERAIKNQALALIDEAQAGDRLRLSMFYLADRQIIKALIRAAQRGVVVKVLLDANKDAFGYQKNGIPNRPAAAELLRDGGDNLSVRWYRTSGEQFHTKQLLLEKTGRLKVLLGSANYTRRNLNNYNLEADVMVDLPRQNAMADYIINRFEAWYNNQGGQYSLNYEVYANDNFWLYWLYRFQEWSGLSSF